MQNLCIPVHFFHRKWMRFWWQCITDLRCISTEIPRSVVNSYNLISISHRSVDLICTRHWNGAIIILGVFFVVSYTIRRINASSACRFSSAFDPCQFYVWMLSKSSKIGCLWGIKLASNHYTRKNTFSSVFSGTKNPTVFRWKTHVFLEQKNTIFPVPRKSPRFFQEIPTSSHCTQCPEKPFF